MRPTTARVTVFLVGEDHSTLDSLAGLLHSAGYTTKAYSALKTFSDDHNPSVHGCVVLDVGMTLDGLDLQRELVKRNIDRPIILLTGKEPVPANIAALKGGGVDLLIGPHKGTELLGAVKVAVKRDSDRLHALAVARLMNRLSLRERQILALGVRGMSNKKIAAALGIREISVSVNCERALKKIASKSIAEVVRMKGKNDMG